MFKKKLILTFHAQTPVHMGSGVSVSYVDNPIQREKYTDFPILSASGIKGVIRDLAERVWKDNGKINIIFGPEAEIAETQNYASCIAFTDAKILLYPVRSMKGVFAYVTCPYVLNRFKNELKSIGEENSFDVPEPTNDDKVIIHSTSKLKIDENKVALEEFVFDIHPQEVDELANALSKYLPQEIKLNDRLAIVSDNVFTDFVKYAVEIRTRIRIDQTKGTVAEGALFSIELVPSESVFYGFLFVTDPYDKSIPEIQTAENVLTEMKELFQKGDIIQLGGDETLGTGLMKVKFFEPQELEKQK